MDSNVVSNSIVVLVEEEVYNTPEEECTLDAAEHILVVVVHNKDLLPHSLIVPRLLLQRLE